MFENFTENAFQVVSLAQQQCQNLGNKELTTGHIIFGLINQTNSITAIVLKETGIDGEKIGSELEKIQPLGKKHFDIIPNSPHTTELFDLALQEAEKLKDTEIDTHHLLLGLLRQTEGLAIKVLRNLQVDFNQLRNRVYLKLVEQGHPYASQFLPDILANNSTKISIKVYLEQTRKILENPECQEAKLIKNNPHIFHPNLIETIEGVALILRQQGDLKGAEILSKLINPGSENQTENTRKDLPEPTIEEEVKPLINVQVYTKKEIQQFLYKLLGLMLESQGDEEVIYPFLRDNLDKLNTQFCEVLQEWGNNTFVKIPDDHKPDFAKRILKISGLIRKLAMGNKSINLEIALIGYEIVAPFYNKTEYSEEWAIIQNCLGLIYSERIEGNRIENLIKAREYFTNALRFYSQAQFPQQRKIILASFKKATNELLEQNKATLPNIGKQSNETTNFRRAKIKNNNLSEQEKPEQNQNQERIQAYFYLIEQLLRSPQSQLRIILNDNSELLDSGLIKMMTERAEAEKNRGNIQDYELLISLVEQVNERLGLSLLMPDSVESLPVTNLTLDETTKRQQAYRNLIDEVLGSPQQSQLILMSNFELLDGEFVKTIEEVITEYREQKEDNIAAFLEAVATGVTELINNKEWLQQLEEIKKDASSLGVQNSAAFLRNMNEQMFHLMQNLPLSALPEEYLKFIGMLFHAMGQSQHNPDLIYPILEANLNKLDDNFSAILQGYASFFLSQNSPELAQGMAGGFTYLGNLMIDFPLGNKAFNIEIAIDCYKSAITVFTRNNFPEQWAVIQNNLGIAYCQRIRGDKPDNLEEAIKRYENALQIRINKTSPEWAETQLNLGMAYLQRIRGDKSNNLELALQFTQAALTVYNPSEFPERWAKSQINLGEVYRNRIGKKAENLELAIECFNSALTIENNPYVWATIQNNLGVTYLERIRGDKSNNLELALSYLNASLTVFTPSTYPFEWARTQNNLANAYYLRIQGIKKENLEEGLNAIKLALTVYNLENFPQEWALTLLGLSNICVARIEGKKADNIELAIEACKNAFIVLTENSFPQKWAEGQMTLGNAYSQRIEGKTADNWEEAIKCYESALTVLTEVSFPDNWGDIQHNLSRAYMNRICGKKPDNLKKAVEFGEASLRVRTYNDNVEKWAESQDNLARVYSALTYGEKIYNLERSIQTCQETLKIYSSESSPERWAMLQDLLGDLYIERIEGTKAENIELAITALRNAGTIYTRENFPERWANNQHSLSMAYRGRICGDRAENMKASLEACELSLTVFTREDFPERWASSQINRGLAYWRRLQGDRAENMEQAIASCEAALTVYNQEDFPTDWALVQINLGGMYFDRVLGDQSENFELSITAYEEALNVYNQDDFPFYYGQIHSNLSNTYRMRIEGDPDENIQKSITACENALSVHKRETSPYHWANTKLSLGNSYTICFIGDRSENLEKGITAYEDAMTVYKKEQFPREWAMIQNNLGELYRQRIKGNQKENFKRAIVYLNEALKVSEFTYDPFKKARTLYNLGFTYFRAKKLYLAHQTLETCIETVESVRGEIISGELGKLKNSEQSFIYSQLIVKVCLDIAEKYINPKYKAKALEYVERNKARNLVEMFSTRDLLPKDVDEETINELKRLRQEIFKEQQRLDNYRNLTIIENNQNQNNQPVAIIPDRTHLNKLQQELDTLITYRIKPKEPQFSDFQKVEIIVFSDIKNSLLDDKTVIIEWFFTLPYYQSSNLSRLDKFDPEIIGTNLYTFIVLPEKENPEIVDIELEKYEQFLKLNTEYLRSYLSDQETWENQLEERLKRLADILKIDEVMSYIDAPENMKKYERVILIPHWHLHLYPLHTLPLSSSSCLLDRFNAGVSYAPNCQLLKMPRKTTPPNLSQFFAIQNPTEAGKNLIYADIEVETIKQKFETSDVLAGENAKKEDIIPKLPLANCIHFSCHGNFNFSNSLESALILAEAFKNNKFDLQKCLILLEIFGLNLSQCWLVSLSACETGIIDLKTSHVEYIGIPSGFLYAGASYVVSSLWSVYERSTAFLMIKFYQNLFDQEGKKDVIKALREAQLWLRELTNEDLFNWIKKYKISVSKTFGSSRLIMINY